MVIKRRVSAFAGSDLDVLLRARRTEHLVLAGIATSGVVLSTLRQAADLDYRLTVLADGCLDADPEVHQVLLRKVFPRQAEVTTIADWTAEPGHGLIPGAAAAGPSQPVLALEHEIQHDPGYEHEADRRRSGRPSR